MTQIAIPPIDRQAQEQARRRWNSLTKPAGSLGKLEDLAVRIAGMTGDPVPSFERKLIFTVAADHGVVQEGVSAYPQAVTAQMVANFLNGGAAINVLARQVGAQVQVVDAGVAAPLNGIEALVHCGIRAGTGNMAREPAMSRQEAQSILGAGLRIFEQAHRTDPIHLVGLGDMGIGNTTASAALAALWTGRPVSEVTGCGTGLTGPQRLQKVRVIEQALNHHRPDPADPIGCLAAVGGLEIGCLAGITLGAAQARVPVVLDGFITSVAAWVACRLAPEARDYLIASHLSVEPGHSFALDAMGLTPLFDLQMRLGEGTGAALGFFLVESSLKLLKEMATFSEAGVAPPLDLFAGRKPANRPWGSVRQRQTKSSGGVAGKGR